MKNVFCLSVILVLGLSSSLYASNGRIELSQASFSGGPYVVSNSASYVFTEHVTVSSGDGIYISADDVHIDLNGFTFAGSGTASGDGISQAGNDNVTIENGTIYNWNNGLRVFGNGNRIRDVEVRGCSSGLLLGDGAYARDCVVRDCGADGGEYGILGGIGSRLINCLVSNSGSTTTLYRAIFADIGSTLSGCTIQNISAATTCTGISMANSSHVSGCTLSGISAGQVAIGIDGGLAAVVNSCSIYNLTSGDLAAGIQANSGATVEACGVSTVEAADFSYGIRSLGAGVLRGCSVTSVGATNSLGSEAYGIYVIKSAVIGCSASFVTAPTTNSAGIYASRASVRGCVASDNQIGIACVDYSMISDNASSENTIANYHAPTIGSGGNVVRDNLSGGLGSTFGYLIERGFNFVARNVDEDTGTAFSFGVNNNYGPLNSNPGASFTNDHPWVNFFDL